MIKIEDFEEYGLSECDFKIDTYKTSVIDANFKRGVEVGIPRLEISVKCHGEKSQIKSKAKCLEMIKIIIDYKVVNLGIDKKDFGEIIKM